MVQLRLCSSVRLLQRKVDACIDDKSLFLHYLWTHLTDYAHPICGRQSHPIAIRLLENDRAQSKTSGPLQKPKPLWDLSESRALPGPRDAWLLRPL